MSISSLFTGVSSLTANQQKMDVIGDNLANSNTTGFKSSRVNFGDLLYNTIDEATAATATAGGEGPDQVGSGVAIASVVRNFSQGTLRQTNRMQDLAINGDGFVPVTNGTQIFYTRDGALGLDAEGTLVHLASGLRVVALEVDENGAPTGTPSASSTLRIPVGQLTISRMTSQAQLGGNLDAGTDPGGVVTLTLTVYDSLGKGHDVTVELTRSVTAGEWGVTAASGDGAITLPATGDLVVPPQPAEIAGASLALPITLEDGVSDEIVLTVNGVGPSTLDLVTSDRTFTSLAALRDTINSAIAADAGGVAGLVEAVIEGDTLVFRTVDAGAATAVTINDGAASALALLGFTDGEAGAGADEATVPAAILAFDDLGRPTVESSEMTFTFANPDGARNPQAITLNFEALTQQEAASTAAVRDQNGVPPGLLTSFRYNPDGKILGVFNNGLTAAVGQLVLAQFQNVDGLQAQGANLFATSVNSGAAVFGQPGEGSLGAVAGGQLEASNVDLAAEFADMIVTQRSFQAASRIITTSDDMLQELISIKR